MKSKELLDAINQFHTTRQYHYALMINGPWGCGKTFFVKEELIPYLDSHSNQSKVIYLSLYGIDDVKDITSALLLNTIQLKAGKKANTEKKKLQISSIIAGNIVKTILNKYEVTTDGMEEVLQLIEDFNETFIIFDDLERCNCDINQVLGYINNFVEHTNATVIIIANEEEIGRNNNDRNYELQMMLAADQNINIESEDTKYKKNWDSFNTQKEQNNKPYTISDLELRRAALFNNRDNYYAIKEKVIGQTIEFEPDLKDVFSKLTNKLKNDVLKESILSEIDCLTGYAISDNHKNIRTYQFFLEKINFVFNLIENKYKTTHSELIKYCYRSSIKRMSGKQLPDWDKEIGLQRFGSFWDMHDYINGFSFIDEIIQGNAVDAISINQLLEKYEKQIAAEGQLEDDPIKKLQSWTTNEDDDVKTWLHEIKNKLDRNEYRIILFPRILQYITNFETRDVFKQECVEVWEAMKRSAQTMKEDTLEQLSSGDFFSSLENEKGKKLFCERQKELIEITSSRIKTSEENTYKQAIQNRDTWAENLYNLSTEESVLGGHSFIYWLNTNELIMLLQDCNNEQLFTFRAALHALYKSHVYYQNKEDDLENLQSLLMKLIELNKSSFGEIKTIKINWLIQDLKEYITILGSKSPETAN